MKRNLKALGLAVVAAFAMSAVMAASASAQAQFTADQFPAVFTGHEEGPTNYFEFTDGQRYECNVVTYEATLEEASSSLTVFPTYEGCEAGGQSMVWNMNGCHYVFHAGEATTTTDVHGTADIECSGAGPIEVVIAGGICRIDIPEQSGLEGVTFTNEPANETTPADFITVDVDITDQIEYTDTDNGGVFCPFAGDHTTSDGDFVSTVVIKGYEDEKAHNETALDIHVK